MGSLFFTFLVAEGQSPKDDFENFDKPNFEAPEFENLDSSTPITAGEIEGQNSSQTSGSIFDGDVRTQMFNYASGLRQRSWIKTIRYFLRDFLRFLISYRSPLRFISTGNFSRPQSRTQIMSRVPLNLKFYMTNYILLAVLIMSYSILSSVSLLFLIAAFAWLWIWAMKQDEFRVGPVVVTERMKILVLTARMISK